MLPITTNALKRLALNLAIAIVLKVAGDPKKHTLPYLDLAGAAVNGIEAFRDLYFPRSTP